jgi:MFS family permease
MAAINLPLVGALVHVMFSVPGIPIVVTIVTSAVVLVMIPAAYALLGTVVVQVLAGLVSELIEPEGVERRLARKRRLALVGLLLLAAGLATGAAGTTLAGALSALVESTFRAGPVQDLALGPLLGLSLAPFYAGVVGGLLLAGQYAVSDVYTPPLVYRELARAGLRPPRLDRFLAWADDRLLLRKEGDNYTFLHLLYRDWWAAQTPAGTARSREQQP